MQKQIEGIVITAFELVVLGTLAIPAVLAYIYTWAWLLIYPALLALLMSYAHKKGGGGVNGG